MLALVRDSASQVWANPVERSTYLEKARECGALLGHECQLRRKDGTLVWVSLNGRFVCGPDGQAVFHEGFITDITDRKRAEDRLRESEERYRATFEQASVGMLHTSLDGRIIRCNERFAEIIGYRAAEISGKTFQQITAPEDLPKSNAVLEKMTAESATASSPSEWEKRYVRKDGSLTWVKLTVSLQRDNEGHALHYITVAEDINARKMAEERLIAAQQALKISEERYRTTFEMSSDAVVINRLSDGVYIDANRAFLAILGYEREEVIGRSSLELGIWAEPDDRVKMVEMLKLNPVRNNHETKFRRKNGETFWASMTASLIEVNGIACVLSVSRDISAAKEAEQMLTAAVDALRASEERYRTVFQTCFDGILINRLDNGQCVDVNHMFLSSLGFERSEVIGKTVLELGIWVDTGDRDKLFELLRQSSAVQGFEACFRKKNGETLWGMVSATLTEIDEVPCLISITRDVSATKAAENEIRNLAFFDQLTGLPNRRMLLDRLRHALATAARNGRKQAILFVDLDNFKDLNDSLGHQTGDLMLQQVAARLSACVREADTVARLGGDEFVVMLEELSATAEDAAAQAKAVGEKILLAVGEPYSLSDRECFSTSSIGITLFGDKRESTSEVLQHADIAMYQAKEDGKNNFQFYSEKLNANSLERLTLESSLRHALERAEFELYYQAKHDMATGNIAGMEALLRWHHPDLGIVAPMKFIPVAEETGLIVPIGKWVLRSACEQNVAWQRAGLPRLNIAVNLTARQFWDEHLLHDIAATLQETGMEASLLEIEIHESLLIQHVERTLKILTALKRLGVKIAIDDFGTGYSSLSTLQRFPLDSIKIDRSFIRDLATRGDQSNLTQAIIAMGKSLSLTVVAQGVETKAQAHFLREHACDEIQGFYFNKPVSATEFTALLQGRNFDSVAGVTAPSGDIASSAA